ncbi:MAG TPA: SLBB domain-containing protein [Pyrinomonadaceae bacterium]|jgi:polysaccharide export outer membrane protein|nr:SLBB domain-containing protein [Pyrinomonadaceae bacterium]
MKVIKALLLFAFICTSFPLSLQAQQPQTTPKTPQTKTPQTETVAAKPETNAPRPDIANGSMTARREYLLGPNDVIELRVFGEPQFDGAFAVDGDGKLVVPFVEEPLMAQCRSVKELRKDVETALSKFLKNPRIYLTVKDEKSRTPAIVYGAVRSPAPYEMRRPARLLELISKSGGVTEQQSGTIQISHTQPLICPEPEDMQAAAQADLGEDSLGLPFNIYRVEDLKLGKSEANPYIRPGDVIYVAEALPIYVTGSVVQPSNLYLKEGMTLSRAISIVGGPRNAKESQVRIYRQKPGGLKAETLTIDYKAIKQGKQPDIALQPYDIIEVPENGVWSAKGVAKMLTGLATSGAASIVSSGGTRILY